MNKHIVAGIYDILCDKKKAIAIYRDILASNPNDREAEICLRRLVSRELNFKNMNEEMYKLFLDSNEENLIKIEEWLRWMPKK